MVPSSDAYGLWSLVVINAPHIIIFAFSFTRPRTTRDWRSFGAFSAFILALFTEMYGFPLTLYLLSGWLLQRNPGLDLSSHDAGHLWPAVLGLSGDPHFSAICRNPGSRNRLWARSRSAGRRQRHRCR